MIDEATKSGTENNPQLVSFLKRVEPVVSQQLIQNSSSRAFDGYHVSTHFSSAKIRLWNSLSVDLEQRKVLVPGQPSELISSALKCIHLMIVMSWSGTVSGLG